MKSFKSLDEADTYRDFLRTELQRVELKILQITTESNNQSNNLGSHGSSVLNEQSLFSDNQSSNQSHSESDQSSPDVLSNDFVIVTPFSLDAPGLGVTDLAEREPCLTDESSFGLNDRGISRLIPEITSIDVGEPHDICVSSAAYDNPTTYTTDRLVKVHVQVSQQQTAVMHVTPPIIAGACITQQSLSVSNFTFDNNIISAVSQHHLMSTIENATQLQRSIWQPNESDLSVEPSSFVPYTPAFTPLLSLLSDQSKNSTTNKQTQPRARSVASVPDLEAVKSKFDHSEPPFKSTKGVVWPEPLCRMMVQSFWLLVMIFGFSCTTALDGISRLGYSRKNIIKILTCWKDTGKARPPFKKRGRGAAVWKDLHPPFKLTDDQREKLFAHMLDEHENGRCVTANRLVTWLALYFAVVLTREQVVKLLKSLKCRYSRMSTMGVKDKQFHGRRIARYIAQYQRALKLQANGNHKIVFTDESYCFNNHTLGYSWVPPGCEPLMFSEQRSGRFILFHAMTDDGLLFEGKLDSDGQTIISKTNAEGLLLSNDDLRKRVNSAEFIYQHRGDIIHR